MSTLPISELTRGIALLLNEAYAGPADPRGTWFIDNEPDSGILGLLRQVSAAEASRSADGSGKPGTSIAANAEHLRWSLANANGALNGKSYFNNWAESWVVSVVDEAQWDALRAALGAEFEALRASILRQTELPGDALPGVMALLPHAAFHLGLLRQMLERVRQG